MTDSDKAAQRGLDLLLKKADLLRQEVAQLAMRMRVLERWQTTMDTILRDMRENN